MAGGYFRRSSVRRNAIKNGFRSGLEDQFADLLRESEVAFKYEETKLEYVVPEKKHKYTPDFELEDGSFVETKGRFTAEDRRKHLLLKEQRPDVKIRFVFSNPQAKTDKRSQTSYADWCDKHGFEYLGWKDVCRGAWFSGCTPPRACTSGSDDGGDVQGVGVSDSVPLSGGSSDSVLVHA